MSPEEIDLTTPEGRARYEELFPPAELPPDPTGVDCAERYDGIDA